MQQNAYGAAKALGHCGVTTCESTEVEPTFLTTVADSSSGQAFILVGGWQYPIVGPTVIGRAHVGCPLEDCRRRGFWSQPEIPIIDKGRFIGKHHARLALDSTGTCWIEDLNSLNGTAILRASGAGPVPAFFFEKLSPGRGYVLLNGDLIALAFSVRRGPYLTLSYHT